MGKAVRKKKKTTVKKRKSVAKKRAPQKDDAPPLAREATAVILSFFALFVGVALVSQFRLATDGVHETAQFIAENQMGKIGGIIAFTLSEFLGWCSFVAVLGILALSRTVWIGQWPKPGRAFSSAAIATAMGFLLMVASCTVVAAVLFGFQGGGIIGSRLGYAMVDYVNESGTVLIALTVFLLSLGVATGITFGQILSRLAVVGTVCKHIAADVIYALGHLLRGMLVSARGLVRGLIFVFSYIGTVVSRLIWASKERRRELEATKAAKVESSKSAEKTYTLDMDEETEAAVKLEPDARPVSTLPIKISRHAAKADGEATVVAKTVKKKAIAPKVKRKPANADRYRDYELPSLELLVNAESAGSSSPHDDELVQNSQRLEQALSDFRIGGKVVEVHPGPVITLYQFSPAAGVKVQRIINLADDLALALRVSRVRVYAPVPGKGTVGIEVPNADREIVRLREVLGSPAFQNSHSPLELALGKDTFGEPFADDLSRMPHLLIAGATGTGKSVCINSILLSLLYRNTPDDLRLIMIDPKMLELTVYERIPHLKSPVVTNPKHAKAVLCWAVEEMERRYQLMRKLGVRGLTSYNKAVEQGGGMRRRRKGKQTIELEERDVVSTNADSEGLDRKDEAAGIEDVFVGPLEGHEQLPRIVIVVDELADLMLTVGREIEELLTRLAQKARAAGIHLILATQRPSVNVITGLIKANFPSRISFQVATKIDARTVLDTSGAEKLVGMGDMLFLPPGTGNLRRLHSPFVSDKEVQDVVEWICKQGAPDYDPDIEETIERLAQSDKSSGGFSGGAEEEYDAYYDQAVQLVVEKGQASTSMVQRAFRIGYNRAARILETMEQEGIVGPADGARPRPVLTQNHDSC